MNNLYSTPLNFAPELLLAGLDLFLSLAVIAGVVMLYMVYLMFRPLIEEGEISADEWNRLEDDSLALLRQRDRVISELKEIEFEAAMNKLDAHDLTQLRGQYQREALRLIEELERQSADYSEQFPTQKQTKNLTPKPTATIETQTENAEVSKTSELHESTAESSSLDVPDDQEPTSDPSVHE